MAYTPVCDSDPGYVCAGWAGVAASVHLLCLALPRNVGGGAAGTQVQEQTQEKTLQGTATIHIHIIKRKTTIW